MLITCKDMSKIDKLKFKLRKESDMNDLVATKKMLLMKNRRERKVGKLWFSHKKYRLKDLKKFNMQIAKPVSSPLVGHFSLSAG